jgi:hypothetical protein
MADNRSAGTRAARSRTTRAAADAPAPTEETTKRLTLDIPERLHFAMKMQSTETSVPMVDEVTPLLMKHYADAMRRYPRR